MIKVGASLEDEVPEADRLAEFSGTLLGFDDYVSKYANCAMDPAEANVP